MKKEIDIPHRYIEPGGVGSIYQLEKTNNLSI